MGLSEARESLGSRHPYRPASVHAADPIAQTVSFADLYAEAVTDQHRRVEAYVGYRKTAKNQPIVFGEVLIELVK